MPPKSKPTPLPSSGLQMSLRPGRATIPGAPDKPRQKRTPSEVAEEKLRKENEKLTKLVAVASKIKNLARLENKMQADDVKLERDANHPPANRRQKQPRVVVEEVKKKATTIYISDSEEECDEDQPVSDDESKSMVEIEETVEVAKKGKVKTNAAKNAAAENKATKPQEEMVKKRQGKAGEDITVADKKKAKMVLRQQVMENREPESDIDIDKNSAIKRKQTNSTSDSLPVPPKKRGKTLPQAAGGLKPNWKQRAPPAQLTEKLYSRKSSGTSSTLSRVTSIEHLANSGVSTSATEENVQYGGISDGDDESERRAAQIKVEAKPIRFSMAGTKAKVQPTTSITRIIPNPVATARSNNKKPSIKDLPAGLQDRFSSHFMPRLRDIVATLPPWDQPDDDDIRSAFGDAYYSKLQLHREGDVSVISKLADDRLTDWRHQFANIAMATLEKIFASEGLDTPQERAEYVAEQLGTNEKKRPYYYKEYYNEDSGQLPIGIFQSYIIVATFASHLSSISSIRNARTFSKTRRPVGALVLTLQAVLRAFTYFRTGVKVIPGGQAGYFSKTNWGDRIERRDGRDVHVKIAGSLVKLVNLLKDKQWQKILTEAAAHAKQKNGQLQLRDNGVWVEASSDYEIEDGDEDLLDCDDDGGGQDFDIGIQPDDNNNNDNFLSLRNLNQSDNQNMLLDGDDDFY